MKNIKLILNIITGSLKAKIITGVIAVAVVGSTTAGIVTQNIKSNSQANETKQNSIAVNNEKEKDDSIKNDNDTAITDNDQNKKAQNTEADNKANVAANTNTATNKTANTNNNPAPAPTPKPQPAPTPQPTPAPAPKPVRPSGIDQALTDKLNADGQTVFNYNRIYGDTGKTDELIQSAKNIAVGGEVVEDIKTPWVAKIGTSTVTSTLVYKGQSVNVVVGETNYYYTRFPKWYNDISGFSYVVAYWDSSINNYKLYYICISLTT